VPLVRRQRRAFYDPRAFPEIVALQSHWREIRDEVLPAMAAVARELGRPDDQSWILPLLPEPEDRGHFADAICARARAYVPLTARLAGSIPYAVAYAISKMVPGKHVTSHSHWNPFLTAIVCLQDGGDSHLLVDGQRHDYRDGNLVIFDYTLPHEAKNEGHADRYVLLLGIDRRLVSSAASSSTTASRSGAVAPSSSTE
jgi:aspartyl/asparaginyl beta-hydroxylase (cupin superfamily)